MRHEHDHLASGDRVSYSRPDNYGTTPLHYACFYGPHDLVEQLLGLSEEPRVYSNAIGLRCGTPLYTAAAEGHASIVKLLLDHGAMIETVCSGNILGSALMAACAHGHTEAVTCLLANVAALEVEGSRFKSAAGTARAFRQEEVLKVLGQHEKSSRPEHQDQPLAEDQEEQTEDDDACANTETGITRELVFRAAQ